MSTELRPKSVSHDSGTQAKPFLVMDSFPKCWQRLKTTWSGQRPRQCMLSLPQSRQQPSSPLLIVAWSGPMSSSHSTRSMASSLLTASAVVHWSCCILAGASLPPSVEPVQSSQIGLCSICLCTIEATPQSSGLVSMRQNFLLLLFSTRASLNKTSCDRGNFLLQRQDDERNLLNRDWWFLIESKSTVLLVEEGGAQYASLQPPKLGCLVSSHVLKLET